jgi:hypothetical protein
MLRLSSAVLSVEALVLQGSLWLAVTRQPSHVHVAVNGSSLCRIMGANVLMPRTQNGLARLLARVSDGSTYAVETSVRVTVQSPLLRLQPTFVNSLLRRSSVDSNRIECVLTLFNDGDLPLEIGLSFRAASVLDVTASTTHLILQPGNGSELLLSAVLSGNVPDVYGISVVVSTNVPACDGTFATVTVPWSVHVTDLLFVPPSVAVTLSPDDSHGIVSQLLLANFAGNAALCAFDVSVSDGQLRYTVSMQPLSGLVAIGALFPVNVTVSYPAQRPRDPEFGFNVSARCETDSGSVLGASSSQFRVQWTSGAPSASYSTARVLSDSILQRGSPVVVHMTVRDIAGNVVSGRVEVASSAIAARFIDTNNAVLSAQISSIVLAADAVSMVASVATSSLSVDTYDFEAIVSNTVVLQQSITMLQVSCPHPLVLPDATSTNCVCNAGDYKQGDTCVPCPRGTFKRSSGNTTIFGCVACPSDWYCIAGASTPTARCPVLGYSCLNGVLSVQPGYTVADFTEAPTWIAPATRCLLYQACPNSDGVCAAGYTGRSCMSCTEGYTTFQNHCKQCPTKGIGSAFLVAWFLLVIACSAIVTTLLV